MLYITLIALGLSVDTFVLAIAIGLSTKQNKNFNPFKYCAIFGIAQAGLFALGSSVAYLFPTFNLGLDFHLSSIVFFVLGIKMLIEFLTEAVEPEEIDINQITKIAFLTSIDAFVVGVTKIQSDTYMTLVLAIFIVTTIFALVGMEVSRHLKKVNLIEHYSLLVGSVLLFTLAFMSF